MRGEKMWMTIIVVLGLDPVFQGTASPLSDHLGAGVFETRDACESDLMAYFQTFDGEGESRLSFTKNQWGNYRITKEHGDKAFRFTLLSARLTYQSHQA